MYFNNLDFDWYDEMHTSQSILQPVVKLEADSLLSNDSLLHNFNRKLKLFLYNLYIFLYKRMFCSGYYTSFRFLHLRCTEIAYEISFNQISNT